MRRARCQWTIQRAIRCSQMLMAVEKNSTCGKRLVVAETKSLRLVATLGFQDQKSRWLVKIGLTKW